MEWRMGRESVFLRWFEGLDAPVHKSASARVGMHDSLGLTGRAGGVEDVGDILRARLGRRCIAGRTKTKQAQPIIDDTHIHRR